MTDAQARRLGLVISKARHKRRMSLRAVADAAEVSFTFVRRVEIGLYTNPSIVRLTRLITALDLPPEQVDVVTDGQLSHYLPPMDVYLRAKCRLASGDAQVVGRIVRAMQSDGEGGDER